MGPIGVRPEATRISRQKPDSDARASTAVIQGATFLGSSVQVEAKLTSGETVVSELSRLEQPFTQGEKVHVWWRAGDELRPAS